MEDLFRIIALILAFAIGNFAYQAFGNKNWNKALEISVYEIVAILGTWWILT